jgi:hypothetical protein
MCCCQLCCKGKLRQKYGRRRKSGPLAKSFAWLLYLAPPFIVGICIAAHMGGSNYFSVALNVMGDGVFGIFDDVTTLIDNVTPTFNLVIDNLIISANEIIDDTFNSVDIDKLEETVLDKVREMANALKAAQINVDSIKSNLAIIGSSTETLQTLSTDLITSNIYLI